MTLELTQAEAAVLLLVVGLGMAVYHDEDELTLETLTMLDRLPPAHLAGVMRKLGVAAAAMEGSDAD